MFLPSFICSAKSGGWRINGCTQAEDEREGERERNNAFLSFSGKSAHAGRKRGENDSDVGFAFRRNAPICSDISHFRAFFFPPGIKKFSRFPTMRTLALTYEYMRGKKRHVKPCQTFEPLIYSVEPWHGKFPHLWRRLL